jgi:hypothetical protein
MRSREDITFAPTVTKAQHDAPGTAAGVQPRPEAPQEIHAAGVTSAFLRHREGESSSGALRPNHHRSRATGRDRRLQRDGRRLRGGTAPDGAHNPVFAGSTPAPAIASMGAAPLKRVALLRTVRCAPCVQRSATVRVIVVQCRALVSTVLDRSEAGRALSAAGNVASPYDPLFTAWPLRVSTGAQRHSDPAHPTLSTLTPTSAAAGLHLGLRRRFCGVPADREVCSGRADDSSALPTQPPFVPAYRLLASAPGFFARASSLLPAVARSLGRWFDAFVRAAGRRRRRSAVSAKPHTPTSPRPLNTSTSHDAPVPPPRRLQGADRPVTGRRAGVSCERAASAKRRVSSSCPVVLRGAPGHSARRRHGAVVFA